MITGKKINELDDIIDPTLETVLPAVKIEGSTISDTAGKLTIQDLKTLSQQGVVKNPNIVTDLTSTTINIDNLLPNTIYQYNTLSSLTISNFTTSYELSSIYFKTSNSSFNLTFTNQPVWIDGSQPIFELNKEYILNIKNGIVWVQGIKVDSTISVIDINSFPATLSTNINYTATISGSATFTLPTPSNTSIENTINILLNVTATTTVDWGVNANSVLTSFAAGKYELRLRYNNNTSNWIGEVLKAEEAPNPVKLYVPFNNTAEDLSNNPVSLSAISPDTTFPTYGDGKFAGTNAILTKQYKGFTVGGDKTKLNLGSGDFTLSFWIKSTASGYNDYNHILYSSSSTFITPKQIYYNNNIIFNDTNVSYDGEFHYVVYARHNNSLYRFVDGTRTKKITYSGNIDFSDITRIAAITSSWGTDQDAYVQEILLKNTCDYDDDTTTISVPTSPYVISDNSLADLHDNTKQNDLTTIKGFDASKTQTLKNVQGVLTWVDD